MSKYKSYDNYVVALHYEVTMTCYFTKVVCFEPICSIFCYISLEIVQSANVAHPNFFTVVRYQHNTLFSMKIIMGKACALYYCGFINFRMVSIFRGFRRWH